MTNPARPDRNPVGWVPDNDFSDRLAVIRSRMSSNYAEIGALCGLDGEAWGRWELKGHKPRNFEEICRKISDTTGVDLVWLMTGIGEANQPPSRRILTGGPVEFGKVRERRRPTPPDRPDVKTGYRNRRVHRDRILPGWGIEVRPAA